MVKNIFFLVVWGHVTSFGKFRHSCRVQAYAPAAGTLYVEINDNRRCFNYIVIVISAERRALLEMGLLQVSPQRLIPWLRASRIQPVPAVLIRSLVHLLGCLPTLHLLVMHHMYFFRIWQVTTRFRSLSHSYFCLQCLVTCPVKNWRSFSHSYSYTSIPVTPESQIHITLNVGSNYGFSKSVLSPAFFMYF